MRWPTALIQPVARALCARCISGCSAGCFVPLACQIGTPNLVRRKKLEALNDEIREKFRSLEEEYR